MDLQRVEMLLGTENLAKLQQAKVAVLGLGGVGSYVAEALCRSGIGYLMLVDADKVEASNINRQLPALQTTIGKFKTEVMGERLHQINPDCRLQLVSQFYHPGNFDSFFSMARPGKTSVYPDFIADAIDSTASKVDMLAAAWQRKVPVISAMGTGNKLDPTQLRLEDISQTKICPLAKSIRKKLRQLGIDKGITVVCSEELPQCARKSLVPGSMVFVPAAAGLLMASYIVRKLVGISVNVNNK